HRLPSASPPPGEPRTSPIKISVWVNGVGRRQLSVDSGAQGKPAIAQSIWRRGVIVLIDNYDSFTFNLVQRLGEIDSAADLRVFRNDEITTDEIAKLKPSHLIISPGPCTPTEAGISCACIETFAGKLPILGVCLGHQSIGQATGGKIVRAKQL